MEVAAYQIREFHKIFWDNIIDKILKFKFSLSSFKIT